MATAHHAEAGAPGQPRTRTRGRGVQQAIPSRTHGGARKGAGRKKDLARGLVDHAQRPVLTGHTPAHVTLRFRKGVWNLRSRRCFRVISGELEAARAHRPDARFVQFSLLGNHMHLIVEAPDRGTLARRVQGLAIRIARSLNRLMQRTGPVFADRYHVRVLGSPREVRAALAYVLRNAFAHYGLRGIDEYSSGPAFDGWRGAPVVASGRSPPVSPAASWVLTVGWRRAGLLAIPT